MGIQTSACGARRGAGTEIDSPLHLLSSVTRPCYNALEALVLERPRVVAISGTFSYQAAADLSLKVHAGRWVMQLRHQERDRSLAGFDFARQALSDRAMMVWE